MKSTPFIFALLQSNAQGSTIFEHYFQSNPTGSLLDTTNGSDLYKAFASYLEGHELEASKVPLNAKFEDYQVPEWADGALVSSGPSFHKAGKRQFRHYLDGFGRFSKFDIKNGEVHFSSKMLESEFYKACKKQDDIVASLLFSETDPPRWKSRIPFYDLVKTAQYGDNNWVSMEKLPGDGPFYTSTDSPVRLTFNPKTLEPEGKLHYEDHELTMCMFGVSHSKVLEDGSQVSICGSYGHGMKPQITVFKISPDEPLKRQVITKIPTDQMAY